MRGPSDLLRLPVDEIKIDSSFVIGMLPVDQRPKHAQDDQDPESNAALVRRLVQLGRDLGKEVVAEGIQQDGWTRCTHRVHATLA